MPLLQLGIALVAGIDFVDAEQRPVGGMGVAVLVAHPAATGTAVGENDGVGLQAFYCGMGAGKVVVGAAVYLAGLLGTAVPAVAAVGTVEPHLEDVAILAQKLFQLGMEILHVEGGAVEGLVAVPGREVEAELEAVLTAGGGQFAHDVALAVLVGGVADAVVGVFRGPQAETVVVLGGEDDAFHAGGLHRGGPLTGVQPGGGETAQWCIAVAPLAVAEGVGAEVYEGVSFHLLPRHLLGGGQRTYRGGSLRLGGGGEKARKGQDGGEGAEAGHGYFFFWVVRL